jgi:cytidylate kinase
MDGCMERKPVITVDGPAGAGKSTITREIAHRLSFVYLDTGALYRAMAYYLKDKGFSNSKEELTVLARSMNVTLQKVAGQLHVCVNGEDVTNKIRSEEIGLLASKISAEPLVREVLLSVQRNLASTGGVVAEGRDMGTVVFPDAEIKFFLDASVDERAKRRFRELIGEDKRVRLEDVRNDIVLRDRQDRERPISPLRVPSDAVVIDSTDKSISQVIDIMMSVIDNKCFPRE